MKAFTLGGRDDYTSTILCNNVLQKPNHHGLGCLQVQEQGIFQCTQHQWSLQYLYLLTLDVQQVGVSQIPH